MANFAIPSILTILLGMANFNFGYAANPEEAGDYMEGDIVSVAPSLLLGRTRSGMVDGRFRWPNAIIPYEFATGYPSDLQAVFRRAIQQISEKTCIKFVQRKAEKDYISLIQGNGCYSHVGRIGGKQVVSLPKNCNSLGTFIHELMHAIGFFHEQSRTDRDDFVDIKLENIRAGMAFNFNKFGANLISPFGVTYDYGSVMHYGKTAFSKDGKDTIVPKKTAEIGQRRGMSAGDATKINNMYCKANRKSIDDSSSSVHKEEERPLKLF